MPKQIKNVVDKYGTMGIFSEVFNKLILIAICFFASQVWAQYKQVGENEKLTSSNLKKIEATAKVALKNTKSVDGLHNSFDSLIVALDKKAIRDSITASDVSQVLKLMDRIYSEEIKKFKRQDAKDRSRKQSFENRRKRPINY